jgi:hypothetical protein
MRLAGRERQAAAAFTLVVVALRVWIARQVSFCGTPDSCYALGLAQVLAIKHAFRVPFLFDLQLHTLHVPNTGLEYWRPGVSLLLLLLKPFGALTLHGSLVVATLAGVVWALAAWHVAMRATGSRAVALAGYALCLLLPPGWEGSLTPDPTLFYAAAIAWFLALFTARRQGLWQDLVALLCVGAAYLIRNDAGLVLVPLLVVLWMRRRRGAEARRRNEAGLGGTSALYAGTMLVGFLIALIPMHLLYHYVMGTAFAEGASQALFLNNLSDFSNYGAPVSLHTMLSYGVKHLVAMRIGAGAMIVYRVLALVLGYAALVFLPSIAVRDGAADQKRLAEAQRMPEVAGAVAFGAAVLIVYSVVLPAVGVFSALRSSTGLLPVVSVVVIVAILRLARTPRVAVVLAASVMAAYAVSGVMDDRREIRPMNAIGAADQAQAEVLADMGARPDDRTLVMTPDPVQFSVMTGYMTAPLAGNGLDAITKEALDLHVGYAILDDEHLPEASRAVDRALHVMRKEAVPGQTTLVLELSPERQTPQ